MKPPRHLALCTVGLSLLLSGCVSGILGKKIVEAPNRQNAP